MGRKHGRRESGVERTCWGGRMRAMEPQNDDGCLCGFSSCLLVSAAGGLEVIENIYVGNGWGIVYFLPASVRRKES